MKLMSYLSPRGPSFGAVDGNRLIDLKARLGASCADLRAALRTGALGVQADATLRPDAILRHEADFHLDDVIHLPVIPNPGKIICVGLNYLAHRLEGSHKAEAAAPTLFIRLPESQVGHDCPLVCPRESDQFDFEAEVAVIIGRGGRRIPQAEALACVAGLACYNDASVRDWQLATSQWTTGKNFPATGAFGPWMVTADELAPDAELTLTCRLNGVEMQRTSTGLMMFPIPELISFVSSFTTLEPGDVIATGTPGGVGLRREPQVWMKHGDIVEVELEGVGVLRNTVIKEAAA